MATTYREIRPTNTSSNQTWRFFFGLGLLIIHNVKKKTHIYIYIEFYLDFNYLCSVFDFFLSKRKEIIIFFKKKKISDAKFLLNLQFP